jgi:hypothetical protein
MEDFPFDSELGWTPDDSIELNYKEPGEEEEETTLQLRWDNTMIYKYRVGDGKYDHIEHHSDDGGSYQFLLDDEGLSGLREKLEQYGYPCVLSPFVEPDLVSALELTDDTVTINQEVEQFAAELRLITGPQDFLSR